MNTKLILTSSAIVLAITGLALTFAPQEIIVYFEAESSPVLELMAQITGGLYFGFAMLNWMSKANLTGGIYNRPLVVANLAQFVIGGLALLNALGVNSNLPFVIFALAIVYVVYATIFTLILFKTPPAKKA